MGTVDLTRFGTKDMPLRASILPDLARCPFGGLLKVVAEMDVCEDDEAGGGPAADTGSAVHMAARMFHTHAEGNPSVAIRVMREALSLYPQADLDAAEAQFRCYAKDPRNINANIVLVEQRVKVQIDPAPDDPTQEAIWIQGTLDQIREEEGRLIVWDIKTGASGGWDMLNKHALQLAAYLLGGALHLEREVSKVGVIRTRDYLSRGKPGPVFWRAPWGHRQASSLLDAIRHRVADIRRGRLSNVPGESCRFCVARQGVGECLPRRVELDIVEQA